MQHARPTVPNSREIEDFIFQLTDWEVTCRKPALSQSVLRTLQRGLKAKYGVKLTQVQLKNKKSLAIAGLVQAGMFKLLEDPSSAKPAQLLPVSECLLYHDVARVVTDAINLAYDLKLEPHDIGMKSVSQVCDEVVMSVNHRRFAKKV